jgi:hypothetical protein
LHQATFPPGGGVFGEKKAEAAVNMLPTGYWVELFDQPAIAVPEKNTVTNSAIKTAEILIKFLIEKYFIIVKITFL